MIKYYCIIIWCPHVVKRGLTFPIIDSLVIIGWFKGGRYEN